MKNIIGIGGSIHDFATCLIRHDRKVFAIEDERLTRVRYALNSSNPCQPSLQYCLNWAGLQLEEVDEVVGNDMLRHFIDPMIHPRLNLINHHYTHACSTFYTSPFQEAAILVVDGAGSKIFPESQSRERETTTYAVGRNNDITVINRVIGVRSKPSDEKDLPLLLSNSMGEFYQAITETIGFGFLQAGKTMGLASYGAACGDDRFVPEIMRFVKCLPQGQFEILIGGEDGLLRNLRRMRQKHITNGNTFSVDASLAYSGQIVLEMLLMHALEYLWQEVQVPNLCLAGGVALNSLANGRIPALTKFKNIYVFFAPGDSGTAVGAAIKGFLNHIGPSSEPLRFHSGPYWGRPYSPDIMVAALNASGLNYSRPADLHRQVAQLLSRGLTVAWYQEGSEFGPRALGHRSILADSRNPKIRDHVNGHIKQREWFRPLAPAVIASAANTYFEMLCESPWMQFVWPVREEFRHYLPGITHIDGGSRVQSVCYSANPSFYTLLEEFQNFSQMPILLNTSLNMKSQPIVETPAEAIDTFLHTELDVLVLGDYLVVK